MPRLASSPSSSSCFCLPDCRRVQDIANPGHKHGLEGNRSKLLAYVFKIADTLFVFCFVDSVPVGWRGRGRRTSLIRSGGKSTRSASPCATPKRYSLRTSPLCWPRGCGRSSRTAALYIHGPPLPRLRRSSLPATCPPCPSLPLRFQNLLIYASSWRPVPRCPAQWRN